MEANNTLLFVFGLIFLVIGFLSPIINEYYGNQYNELDDDIINEQAQEDITSTNVISVLSGIFFWVFNAPVWLNLILTMMRIVFWVIVYDKIRGI